jgi:hypothetical protein
MTLTATANARAYSARTRVGLRAMDAKDHDEHTADRSNICRLEWIAWAIDAARRHKDDDPASAAMRSRNEAEDE